MDVSPHQVERFDAEVAGGKVDDIADAARIAFENHESAHVQRPDDFAIRVGGWQGAGGQSGQEGRGNQSGAVIVFGMLCDAHACRLYQRECDWQQFGPA